jgi:uncharacterized membrane protein YjgN (DUF898 family)
MTDTDTAAARVGRVEFTGARQELLGIMLRGYLLMVPTLGLYRFWQATWKRRFYWQNTVIDGEPIEYTGLATQLLIGFFFALAFFLPIYLALFYLSMQDTNLVLIGYGIIGAIIWFLSGYAIYRARDFRLSRTLWRGIRFDQKGNAWAYALRRFLWSIAMVLSLGIVYPWMASSLWRYRYNHTWYGDRQFDIGGNWRVFAGPYFAAEIINLIAVGFTIGWIVTTKDFIRLGSTVLPGPIGLALITVSVLVFGFTLAWFRTRTASRMLSTVTIGDARLAIRLNTGRLFGQYAGYVAAFVALVFILAAIALLTIGVIYGAAASGGQKPDPAKLFALFQSGSLNVALLIAAYLVVLGAFGLVAEIILGFGWWRLLARGSRIVNPDTLRSVHATDEDPSLIGEGLADALNVGAY